MAGGAEVRSRVGLGTLTGNAVVTAVLILGIWAVHATMGLFSPMLTDSCGAGDPHLFCNTGLVTALFLGALAGTPVVAGGLWLAGLIGRAPRRMWYGVAFAAAWLAVWFGGIVLALE